MPMSFVPTTLAWGAIKFEPMVIPCPILVARYGANLLSADSIVKVPQMAESITEGTLKQFSKRTISLIFCYGLSLLTASQRSGTLSNGTRNWRRLKLTR